MKRRRTRTTGGLLYGVACLCTSIGANAARPKGNARSQQNPSHAPASNSPLGSILVTVVETAGSRTYVRPGSTGGVHPGAVVNILGRKYPVIDSSDSFAVIDSGDSPPRDQDQGWATVVERQSQNVVEVPKPRPLDTWKDAWTAEEAPADSQQPRFVPLGDAERNRRFDVQFTFAAGGLIPLGGPVGSSLGEAELNIRLRAAPFAIPLGITLDASLQGWAAADLATRVGASTRPLLYVRELLASYTPGSLRADFGRMPYAASTLGALDGVRVENRVGEGFSVGAFGGLLPNPLSGAPSLDAQRFGVEARYSRSDVNVRPEAALVLHGSTFHGLLDERRLSGQFSLYPGPSRLGGYFEVSNFDANNPWGASALELTAAGADQSIRLGNFEIGARFDVRQPERSRWLAAFLPASWFCTTVPAPGSNPTAAEPCNGSVDTRAFGEIDGSVMLGNLSVVVGGLTVTDLTTKTDPNMVGAFATARLARIDRFLRLEASANDSRSTYVDMWGGTAGPGVSLLDDWLDVSAYYRLAVLTYSASNVSLVQHGVGGTVVILPSSQMLFTVQAEGMTGNDTKYLTLFGTAMWRPNL
jgi:hypothetical protein